VTQGQISPQQVLDRVRELEHALGGAFGHLRALGRRVTALEAAASLAARGLAPRHPVEFRAQYGEDAALWDLFRHQTSGFFIEAGAFDGYEFSVSYALECVGWTGLLVEPIPERAEQCRARRTGSRVVHAALSHPGAAPALEFTVVDDEWGGMLSYLTTDEAHRAAITASGRSSRRVSVPVTTLDALLADHAGEVDAAVIDVEGGEVDVLRGFDLARFRPKVLMLEDNSRSEHSPLGRYMQQQAYVLAGWVEVSRVYVRADLSEWARRMNV
jgi:FkbM family methyltransferase